MRFKKSHPLSYSQQPFDRVQGRDSALRGYLTLHQFSRKLGISTATWHRIEMAQQNVTLKTLEQICGRLKCTVSDVFGE